jgi:hypothetical protein
VTTYLETRLPKLSPNAIGSLQTLSALRDLLSPSSASAFLLRSYVLFSSWFLICVQHYLLFPATIRHQSRLCQLAGALARRTPLGADCRVQFRHQLFDLLVAFERHCPIAQRTRPNYSILVGRDEGWRLRRERAAAMPYKWGQATALIFDLPLQVWAMRCCTTSCRASHICAT